MIFCVVTLGFGCQCGMKLYTFLYRRDDILKLFSTNKSFIDTSHSDKAQQFEYWIHFSSHVGLIMGIVFYGFAFLVFLYPAIYYAVFGEKILHFGFIIPGTGTETVLGYSLNIAHHVLQIYVVICAVYASEFTYIFLMLNAFAQYDVLELLVDDLNILTKSKDTKTRLDIKACIAELTDQHVKIME
jgi:hypothetical protein